MRLIALALVVLLGACETPYQDMGFMGGVDELQLSDTTYRIIARGNDFTTSDRVQDFVLLRASQIALQRGYKGFVISSETDQSQTIQVEVPGQTTTTKSRDGTRTTTYQPPTTETYFHPGKAVMVKLVQIGGMDAHLIYSQLAPKYGVK
jgi:hypothetical protein